MNESTYRQKPQTVSAIKRLDSLTGMRFVAAAAIVAVHSAFITSYHATDRIVVAVSIIFVLAAPMRKRRCF